MAIKAEELRIGNIILFEDDSNDIVRVQYLFKSSDMWFVHWTKISGTGGFEYGNSLLMDFLPIPLTEELLVQIGFEKCLDDGLGDYQILMGKGTDCNGLFLIYDLKTKDCILGQINHFSHSFGKYRYLHEMQNLYKILSGIELVNHFSNMK